MLAVADGRPELLDPLVPGLRYLSRSRLRRAEEMARSVADVLDRRTRASLRDARGAAGAAASGGRPHRAGTGLGRTLGATRASVRRRTSVASWPGPGSDPSVPATRRPEARRRRPA